jgi:hypothetical protein
MSDFTALHRAGDPLILPNVRDVALSAVQVAGAEGALDSRRAAA